MPPNSVVDTSSIRVTEQSSVGTDPHKSEDIERAKALVRAALEVLAEKPPQEPSTVGKFIDYVNDRWLFFTFIATVVIVVSTSIVREDFSLSYLFDEVAFKQKGLEFKEDEAHQKEKRFRFDMEKFERERASEEFMREQAHERVAFAQSLLDVRRYASAAEVFEEAVKLDSTNLSARRGLLNARIYEQVGTIHSNGVEYDPVVVQRRIRSLLKQSPKDPYAHVARANMLLKSDIDEAERALKLAIQIRPSLAHAHRLLAEIHLIRKEMDSALAEMQTATRLSPWDVRYLETLALIYDEHGEFERALEYFQKALQLDPDYLSILFEIANAYLRRGSLKYAATVQAELIKRLENPSVAALPKNADAYQFAAGDTTVFLNSVDEKRHYACQNMALLAFTLQALNVKGYDQPERYLEPLRKLDLPNRVSLKRLLYHHVDQMKVYFNNVEGIRDRIFKVIEEGEKEARSRKKNPEDTENKKESK